MVFVLFQMYFVFLNQKVKTILFQRVSTEYFSVQMNIYKNRFLSRLGLMHMIATNLCVWLKVLVLETQHGLHFDMHHHQLDEVIRSKLVRFPMKNISLLNKIFLTVTWLTVGIWPALTIIRWEMKISSWSTTKILFEKFLVSLLLWAFTHCRELRASLMTQDTPMIQVTMTSLPLTITLYQSMMTTPLILTLSIPSPVINNRWIIVC